jgi:Ca-activated chloride channel family protein
MVKHKSGILKLVNTILCFMASVQVMQAQYYFRGEVVDDRDQPLQNVRIILQSTGMPYASGVGGAFGIMSARRSDTMSFSLDGYEPTVAPVQSASYHRIVMKMLPFTANLQRYSLLSLTKQQAEQDRRSRIMGDESYNALVENDFIIAASDPEMSVVLNVDRASYSNIRRFISQGSEVPPDAVRIEEMLNYFNFSSVPPGGDSLFGVKTHLSECPWNPETRLFYVQVNARKVSLDKVPPSNLVFLIDASGSMDMPNRLPLLKVAFRKLVATLRPVDTVSIVVYGDAPGVMLQPTSGGEKKKIMDAIDEIEAGGNTPGEAGIMTAYRLAQSSFIKGGNNRVILATDGDFNVGRFAENELEELITKQKQGGVYLTCLGVGMGNYKDSKIEILAKKGNGNFAYLDNEQEAEKVLVKELTQTLYAIADDVYMNIRFDARQVKSYRLIGFDNKVAALADSNKVLEGGEVGSGHSMMAIFELLPADGQLDKPGTNYPNTAGIHLRYRLPGRRDLQNLQLRTVQVYMPFASSPQPLRLAATVALFGSMLRSSPHVRLKTWDDLLLMSTANADILDPMQAEFGQLVLKSHRIYSTPQKKRKKSDN